MTHTRAELHRNGHEAVVASLLVAGVAATAGIDVATGADLPIYFFYLAFVGYATWRLGNRWGTGIAVIAFVIAAADSALHLTAGAAGTFTATILLRLFATLVVVVAVNRVRHQSDALRQSEERFRRVAELAPDVIFEFAYEPEPHFSYINPAALHVLGQPPAAFYADPNLTLKIVHPDDRDQLAHQRDVGRRGEVQHFTARVVHPDGKILWVESRRSPVFAADGHVVGVTGIIRDISAQKAVEADLSHQALHDPLTGLANRTLFEDHLEHALADLERHAGGVAVLYLDLDGFKQINDSRGHPVGDELLRGVTRRLLRTLRPSDTPARLGGDEFAVLVEDVRSDASAVAVAARILDAFKRPLRVGDELILVGVSIGIGHTTNHLPAAELMRRADNALYDAKRAGRGRLRVFRERPLDAADLDLSGAEADTEATAAEPPSGVSGAHGPGTRATTPAEMRAEFAGYTLDTPPLGTFRPSLWPSLWPDDDPHPHA